MLKEKRNPLKSELVGLFVWITQKRKKRRKKGRKKKKKYTQTYCKYNCGFICLILTPYSLATRFFIKGTRRAWDKSHNKLFQYYNVHCMGPRALLDIKIFFKAISIIILDFNWFSYNVNVKY